MSLGRKEVWRRPQTPLHALLLIRRPNYRAARMAGGMRASLMFPSSSPALLFSGVAHLYTTSIGITQPDLLYNLARRVLRFEVVIIGGALLVVGGVGLNLVLPAGDLSESAVPNRLGLAALAQSTILIAVNFGLAGFLASLLNSSK
jgi:hypothetical protein